MNKNIKLKPKAMYVDNKFCGGCGHGIVNRLIAEVLEEMGEDGKAICSTGVGCCSLMPDTFGIDIVQAQHGRSVAVATGIKHCRKNSLVFSYQGDGDALSIGFSETMYAAFRNENICVFLVNNNNYGMTGGQMSPTTLEGQVTTTTLKGRDPNISGKPIDIIQLMQDLDVAYLARGSVLNNTEVTKLRKYIRKAFEKQKSGMGYSLIEILSPCPSNWKKSPLESQQFIKDKVQKTYPLGEFRDKEVI